MEAVKCFKKTISHDPNCAMAYWGIAYALGPNYNHPWDPFDEEHLRNTFKETRRAAENAQILSTSATPIEQALINCINIRFQTKELVPVNQLMAYSREYADLVPGESQIALLR